MRTFCYALATAILTLLPRAHVEGQQGPTFSAHSELVVLHVTVRDKKGAYVTGLTKDAFNVIEDGQAQTVTLFTDTDTPATIGLLIDSSGSMWQHRPVTIASATAFAQARHPQDEIFAIAFNEYVTPVLPTASPFTSDGGVLRVALERNVASRGRTALYDAIAGGVEYLSRGTRERKVLVLLSDGGDNASRITFDELLEKVQASNVVIYTIALIDPIALGHNAGALRHLAKVTGGLAFEPKTKAVIGNAFHTIAADIRSRYTLAYEPDDTSSGRVKRVRVVVATPDHKHVKVRTRTGYVAGSTDAT